MAETFAQRLALAIGKPASTLFVEPGTDRHFIAETALIAVACYLGGKFLDGFVDELGISDLGKSLGETIKTAVQELLGIAAGEAQVKDPAAAMDRQLAVLQRVADQLEPHAGDTAARRKAEEAVVAVLRSKGVPQREASRIAAAVGQQMLAPAAHG